MRNNNKIHEMCIREKFTKRIIGWTVGMSQEEIEAYCQKYNGYLSWYEGIQNENRLCNRADEVGK